MRNRIPDSWPATGWPLPCASCAWTRSRTFVDGLQATLTLSLFNYKPYSADFAYRGASPQEKVSAQDSEAFNTYLDGWIANNLTNPKSPRVVPGHRPLET